MRSVPPGAFLGPALRQLDVDQTVRLLESEGVATKVEGNGKIFPVSDRAVNVLEALVNRLRRSGAIFRGQSPALAVEREEKATRDASGFVVTTPGFRLTARRVILAVGGRSYPGCGTSGDGYAIARSFGHTIVYTRPALVPVRVEPEWVRSLRGLSLADVIASVQSASGQTLEHRREAILFAHFGLSGPAILDVSRAVARHEGPESLTLRLDLLASIPREDLDRRLQAASRQGKLAVASIVSADLPHRLAECLVEVAGIPRGRLGPDLSAPSGCDSSTLSRPLPCPSRARSASRKPRSPAGGLPSTRSTRVRWKAGSCPVSTSPAKCSTSTA